jgi:hypothetical protein
MNIKYDGNVFVVAHAQDERLLPHDTPRGVKGVACGQDKRHGN